MVGCGIFIRLEGHGDIILSEPLDFAGILIQPSNIMIVYVISIKVYIGYRGYFLIIYKIREITEKPLEMGRMN